MNVSIAGVVVEVSGCPEALAKMYDEYRVEPCEPALRLAVGPGPSDWMLHEREDMKLWVSSDRKSAWVLPLMGDGAVDRALRIMMAEALPRRGGVLMHAAAALSAAGVVAFAGESGAGKSTVARLLGDRMIADDTLAVDSDGVAWATPFHNWGQVIPKPGKGKLGRIYVLEKASVDEIVPVENAIAALSRHVMTGPPGFSSGEYLDAVMRVARVPVATLRRTIGGALPGELGTRNRNREGEHGMPEPEETA